MQNLLYIQFLEIKYCNNVVTTLNTVMIYINIKADVNKKQIFQDVNFYSNRNLYNEVLAFIVSGLSLFFLYENKVVAIQVLSKAVKVHGLSFLKEILNSAEQKSSMS